MLRFGDLAVAFSKRLYFICANIIEKVIYEDDSFGDRYGTT